MGSKKLTTEEKICRVVEWLTSSHCRSERAFPQDGNSAKPFDYVVHVGKLFVAEYVSDSTHIEVYDVAELPKWYDAARKRLPKNTAWPEDEYGDAPEFGDWNDAFLDTISGQSPAQEAEFRRVVGKNLLVG